MTNQYLQIILDKGYLVTPDVINIVNKENVNLILLKLGQLEKKPFLVDSVLLNQLLCNNLQVDTNNKFFSSVSVINEFKEEVKKYSVQDFVLHFRRRYESIKNMLMNRSELQNSISINRLVTKSKGEKVTFIGLIFDKSETKNGNIIFVIEDVTGRVNVLINKDKKDLFNLAKSCLLDEIIGVSGSVSGDIIFADNIFTPDVPIVNELKKCPDEVYAVFIGDIHFGIKNFLAKEFNNFIRWINGEYGDEKQRDISSKIRYLFLVGDLVEGVGIYPNQDKDLEINDIYLQYEGLANELKKIPNYINLIVCGGNHDAVRMSEPQPKLDRKYAQPLYNLPNIYIVSNPATVLLHTSKNFQGLFVLLYHGFSLPYIAESIDEIRIAGGQSRVDLIMKYMLQRRHLCPTHGMNLYVPDPKNDNLVIDIVPDIFVTGHIHRVSVSNYKGVTLINSSCWDSQTDDQEKRGLVPEPARIVVVNLKTREASIINFSQDE
jgi:DNA polymerase II small subunit